MKTKADIVNNWLPRYTGMSLDMFEKYIILVNFSHYVDVFSEKFGVDVYGRGGGRDGQAGHRRPAGVEAPLGQISQS